MTDGNSAKWIFRDNTLAYTNLHYHFSDVVLNSNPHIWIFHLHANNHVFSENLQFNISRQLPSEWNGPCQRRSSLTIKAYCSGKQENKYETINFLNALHFVPPGFSPFYGIKFIFGNCSIPASSRQNWQNAHSQADKAGYYHYAWMSTEWKSLSGRIEWKIIIPLHSAGNIDENTENQ